MGIAAWAVVGLIAGYLASKYYKSTGTVLIGNMGKGLIGGLLGGYISTTALHLAAGLNGINLIALFFSTVGALFVIIVPRLVNESTERALSR
ncbi:MAG: hypothetical protein ROW52_01675 [Anaerolineaceae bacterium]|jgi:uncharacterized membrane protein YeaQ/YmgE (transglycosylase-associated protein family)